MSCLRSSEIGGTVKTEGHPRGNGDGPLTRKSLLDNERG